LRQSHRFHHKKTTNRPPSRIFANAQNVPQPVSFSVTEQLHGELSLLTEQLQGTSLPYLYLSHERRETIGKCAHGIVASILEPQG
jgi:hypothetical protein